MLTSEKLREWEKFLMFDTCQDKVLETAVNACARWVRGIKSGEASGRWLSLLSVTGTGKTHLAKQLWRFCQTRDDFNPLGVKYYPTWIYWPSFVDSMRAGDSWGFFEDMQKWPFLAIDDFGAEKDTTGFAADKFNTLLGRRVGKWTLITSNLSPEQLASLDVRIMDRLNRDGNQVVQMETTSYSLRAKK